jgi:hypothetical protein
MRVVHLRRFGHRSPLRASLPIGLVLLGALSDAPGQDLKTAQGCTRLADDAARLSCYDAALGAAKPANGQQLAVAKTDAPSKFGDDGQLRSHPKPDVPKNMTAQIQQVTPLSYGLYRIDLVNGQVWSTTEADPSLTFKVNDSVTISRLLLGGYEVSLAGHATSVSAIRLK